LILPKLSVCNFYDKYTGIILESERNGPSILHRINNFRFKSNTCTIFSHFPYLQGHKISCIGSGTIFY